MLPSSDRNLMSMSHVLPRTLLRAVLLTSAAWPALAAQSPAESVRVLVSRREVRIEFPKDTAHAWGWSDRKDEAYSPSYAWVIHVEGMDGPRSLWVRIDDYTHETRHFPSLQSLVAAAHAQRCSPGMIAQCSDSGMRATVESRRVVLTLRDSAQIARLFGMRPMTVLAWRHAPGDGNKYSSDTVHVHYVAPDIPLPTVATRLDAERSRRRYEESISTIVRFLDGGEPFQPLWLETGDSVRVSLDEMYCRYDSCSSGGYSALRDSGWTIVDTTIARLQRIQRDTAGDIELLIVGRNAAQYVKALRSGRTALRVRGIHGPSDTAASSKPPANEIDRTIIVAPPIDRVEIVPRPDSLRALETLTLAVRVLDRDGREVAGLPWRLEVLDGEGRGIRTGPEPQSIVFTTPGRARIVARLGAHTDTMSVMVVLPNVK